MIVPEQVKCDVCGIEKGETNHWLVFIAPDQPQIPEARSIAFGPIEAEDLIEDKSLKIGHLCGHACAMKRFSQWLETLK